MGDIRTEPSMDDILASIKRIIADDGPARGPRPPAIEEPDDEEDSAEPIAPAPAADPVVATRPPLDRPDGMTATPRPAGTPDAPRASLVSDDVASASRQSLSALSSMVLRAPGADNTLDGLVRDMLRPLLAEWLDANLPSLVETLVEREIARITGKML